MEIYLENINIYLKEYLTKLCIGIIKIPAHMHNT